MRNYYSKFQMRFTTENFTTDWHRLEVGIGAGCTISVIWFVLVMEMLLRSADCSEELVKVRSPKKAFMDDVTLLTQNQKMMEKVLARLDDLITWSRMRFKAKKSRSLTFVEGRQRQVKFFTNKITQRQTTRAGMGTGRLLQISLNANGSSRSPHRKSRILLFGVWRER